MNHAIADQNATKPVTCPEDMLVVIKGVEYDASKVTPPGFTELDRLVWCAIRGVPVRHWTPGELASITARSREEVTESADWLFASGALKREEINLSWEASARPILLPRWWA